MVLSKSSYYYKLFIIFLLMVLLNQIFLQTVAYSNQNAHFCNRFITKSTFSTNIFANDKEDAGKHVYFETGKDLETNNSKNNIHGKSAIKFEANKGQADKDVSYLLHDRKYDLYFTSSQAILNFHSINSNETLSKIPSENLKLSADITSSFSSFRMKFVKANPNPQIEGMDLLNSKSNYFIGNNPAVWFTDISNYAKVYYHSLYPGIDLVYYGNQNQLEYDYIVAPGVDPKLIGLSFPDANKIKIDKENNLVVNYGKKATLYNKVNIYQEIDGKRQPVVGKYIIKNKKEVGFQISKYDTKKPLIIDPVLIYSTYLGGSGGDIGTGITSDTQGNTYVVGFTGSVDFPRQTILPSSPSSGDTFVTKFNSTGELFFSTYFGGAGSTDFGHGITVDSAGNIYVVGDTSSDDFPVVNAIRSTNSGRTDGFITKLNPTGNALIYSTYLGGSNVDEVTGIAVDTNGNLYITGFTESSDFPVANALKSTCNDSFGCEDAFVTKLNPVGNAFIYSTYLGGTNDDAATGIAIDSIGNAYICGMTRSTNFPIVNAIQQTNKGVADAFVSKLSATGNALLYSTYFGGSGFDEADGIAVDMNNRIYVVGTTGSFNFPTTVGAFQTTSLNTSGSAFVSKLDPANNTIIYSTYLSGSENEEGNSIAVDSSGNAYVTGGTSSNNFPVTMDAYQSSYGGGVEDAYITKLNSSGNGLLYSSYLGGNTFDRAYSIAVDLPGNVYITGSTDSSNFPKQNAFQPNYVGGSCGPNFPCPNAFVTKINISSCPQSNAPDCNAPKQLTLEDMVLE